MRTERDLRAARIFILAGLSASFPLGVAWAQLPNSRGASPTPLNPLPLGVRPTTTLGLPGFSPSGLRMDGEGLKKWLNRRRIEDFPKPQAAKKHSEIKCAVLRWNSELPDPVLTVVCPPKLVFAPLYVYLNFSWKAPEDVPKDLQSIIAPPKSQTKIEPLQAFARVWLKTNANGDAESGAKWVKFNKITVLAIEGD